ncbi:LysR substrate-binding domain-containing protein [Polaromonas sp. P1(28)-13]|nr:LysR substrate-binding domain-containing protein [Polaromonas sp. P1(28)-13]
MAQPRRALRDAPARAGNGAESPLPRRPRACLPQRWRGEGFIVREPGSGTRAALEEYLASHRLQPMFIMEMPSDEAIKQAVMAGLGVSLVSLHTIGLEWRSGLIAAPHVEGLPLMRRWHLVNAAAKMLSPAAEAFRYFILERGEAHLAAMFGGETALT